MSSSIFIFMLHVNMSFLYNVENISLLRVLLHLGGPSYLWDCSGWVIWTKEFKAILSNVWRPHFNIQVKQRLYHKKIHRCLCFSNFVYLFIINRHGLYQPFVAFSNTAAMIVGMQIPVQILAFNSWGNRFKSEIAVFCGTFWASSLLLVIWATPFCSSTNRTQRN